MLYIMNIYKKEKPRVLNHPILSEFLVCCLSVQVEH